MEIRQLHSFVEIVEQNSFTAAAQKLYVSQPVLSMQIKELEKELGCKLLLRTSRKMELTDAGLVLYQKAKHMLALEGNILSEITDITNKYSGLIRLGILPSLSISLLSDTLTEFIKENPNVNFEIMEADTNTLLNSMESGLLDIVFVRMPCNLPKELDQVSFSCERMVAAYNKDVYCFPGDLSKPLEVIRLKDYPILISKRFLELFSHACLLNGFNPQIKCSSDHMSTSISWAKKGLGIAIVPYTTYKGQLSEQLAYRTLDNSIFSISLLMVKKSNRYLSKPAGALYDYCASHIDEMFLSE